jgi:hypothetical protein
MHDEQREILREFEALSGNVLSTNISAVPVVTATTFSVPSAAVWANAGHAAAGTTASLRAPVASGSELPFPPTTSNITDLLSGSDAQSTAAKYVRCDSLPAIHSARYALLLRALAAEAHMPAARLERTTRALEKKLLPPPAPPVQEKSRKRPWDAEQLMACMEGWV